MTVISKHNAAKNATDSTDFTMIKYAVKSVESVALFAALMGREGRGIQRKIQIRLIQKKAGGFARHYHS